MDSININKWWVYESHILNTNCKVHKGDNQSIRHGLTIKVSAKNKFNIRYPTETELVALDNMMLHES